MDTDPETIVAAIDGRRQRSDVDIAVFRIEFDEAVDSEEFCRNLATIDDPWRIFGIPTKIRDELTDENGRVYASEAWKLPAVLFDVEDGETTGSVQVTFEVTARSARIYVKNEGCDERVADVLALIDEEYGIRVDLGE